MHSQLKLQQLHIKGEIQESSEKGIQTHCKASSIASHRCCDAVQEKMESAQREAQVLEIKRQGQLKALEAQRAKKEVL